MDWQAQQFFKLWFELGSSQMMGPKSLHQGHYPLCRQNSPDSLLAARTRWRPVVFLEAPCYFLFSTLLPSHAQLRTQRNLGLASQMIISAVFTSLLT